MKAIYQSLHSRRGGFSSMELLIVISLSAVILGGMVVSYGTLVRSQPQVVSLVTVPLSSTRLKNFYGTTDGDFKNVGTAPSYGALAQAEQMREQFYHDVLAATAVFCLPRSDDNTWKPAYIPYNRDEDEELDTPQKFREHVILKSGVSATLFKDFRNPGASATANSDNASIFVLGYSGNSAHIKVLAIYDIDVIRLATANQPLGFHASVKRYTDPPGNPQGTAYSLVFSGGYTVYYPPANPAARVAADFATDGFTPLFVTFERHTRLALRESTAIDRFKLAAERPFYFIWWPDPAARHLGAQSNSAPPNIPQQAYNHMAGRTSFMFTVPMFPAL